MNTSVRPLRTDIPEFLPGAEQVADDPWLVAEIKEHASLKDDWHSLAAAGMANRLSRVSPPRGATLQDMLKPGPSHLWVEGLDDEQVHALVVRLHARIDGLWLALNRLEGNPSLVALTQLCVERDEAEGAGSLLRWRLQGRSAELDQALQYLGELDTVAEKFVRDGDFPSIKNEHLYRAALVSPEAWWTSLVEKFKGL